MNPVDTHITKGIVRWCVVMQVCISVVFLATQSVRLAPVFSGVSPGVETVRAVVFALVPVWAWTLMPSFMVAVFVRAGIMTRQGELTAIYSAGISMRRAARWPMIIALILFVLSAGLWCVAVPAAQRNLRESMQRMLADGMVQAFVPGRFVRPVNGVSFYADGSDGHAAFNGVYLQRWSHGHENVLVAQKADVALIGNKQLRIRLYQGDLFRADADLTVVSFEKMQLVFSLQDAIRLKTKFLPNAEIAPSRLLFQKWTAGTASRREQFEIHRRLVKSLAFLVLALISVALSFKLFWTHPYVAVSSGFTCFLVWHIALRVSELWVGTGDLSPFWAAWLPLFVFSAGAIGWWIYRGIFSPTKIPFN